MSDLISRQAAIDAVTNHCIEVLAGQMYDSITADVYEMAHRHIIDVLRVFPSVQPKIEVVRCKDCKHNYGKKHYKRYNHEDIVCDYFETDGLNDDDFCSYGERRTDETD